MNSKCIYVYMPFIGIAVNELLIQEIVGCCKISDSTIGVFLDTRRQKMTDYIHTYMQERVRRERQEREREERERAYYFSCSYLISRLSQYTFIHFYSFFPLFIVSHSLSDKKRLLARSPPQQRHEPSDVYCVGVHIFLDLYKALQTLDF